MAIRIYSAGQLNQRVQLQQRGAGDDALRESNGAWVNVGAEVWAKVEPLTGREGLAAGALQQTVDTRFILRHRGDVTPDMRVVWKGRAYDVISAEPVDGGIEWLEIMAVHGVRDGRD